MIFDEISEAKKILNNKELEYFDVGKLTILAKYFSYVGKTTKEIRQALVDFCNSQNHIKYDDGDEPAITNAINNSKKYKIREPKTCVITLAELDEIATLNNYKTERIFFVMICLAKYFMETNTSISPKEYTEKRLVFWKSTSELFKLARYSENFFNRNIIIGDIEDLKYIKTIPNKERTKNSIEIKTYYPDSEPIIFFDNPEFVYKLYKAYREDKIIRCSVCGNSAVKNSNRQSMCEKCWKEKDRVRKLNVWNENKDKYRKSASGLENTIKPL